MTSFFTTPTTSLWTSSGAVPTSRCVLASVTGCLQCGHFAIRSSRVRGQNLSAGTEGADGVCVSECVHGRDNPQIARAVKHYREQQTDSKDGCEHRYRERRLREQVVIVQRAERVEQIADEDSRQRAPAPDELRLQHSSIQHFLVETVNQVRNKY